MRISVVIPTYYRPNDLSKLFESILRQTLMPLEIIVVDDTPTHEIKVVCEDYVMKFKGLGSKLTYVKNPEERSLSIARNIGAKIAKGDIIMFFDSDLILYPNYIEKILDVFQSHSNALGVQGWIANISEFAEYIINMRPLVKRIEVIFGIHEHLVKDQCKIRRYPIILTKIVNCEYLAGANMSFKRDVFEDFQFDERLKKYSYMEDILFGFNIYRRYPNSLYITPYAKCIHTYSKEGRIEDKELKKLNDIHRKYVLTKLFGFKGAFLFFRQNAGILILELIAKISNSVK